MRPPQEKIEAVFHDALALPPSHRRAFLDQACAGDPNLLREVEALLQQAQPRAFEAAVQPMASDLFATALMEPELAPGAMLGPYRLDRKLGEGGMGSVYLARDTRLAREVAVKVISPALARTSEARARFLREARSAAALCHANIATVHDLGEFGETPWLVMEYVEGVSLRSLLTGPLAENTVLRYAGQIAAALEHAHSRHIIHRDIKPENVLVQKDDHVKVIDFGLARVVQEQQLTSSGITRPNAFIGTLTYAAPELLAGGSASPRSDVYSLGVVLYEMACGQQPFARFTGHALISAIVTGNHPEPRTCNPHLTPTLAALINRCMSREPAARYKDAAEVAAALRKLDDPAVIGESESAPPTLAITDFRNIGGTSDLDWLGTGIAETLSADLAKLKSVRVISRRRVVESLRRLGRAPNEVDPVVELDRHLGARWVVSGAYQRVGERIRITTALLDTVTGDNIAAEKIDGRWDDLFEVQDRVVAVLLKALTIGFDSNDRQKILPVETRNIMAYEAYMRGRKQMYQMHATSLAAAIVHFQQGVSLDPDYALAYSGLGTAHALQFIHTSNPEDIAHASCFLERAIELDPELGEPYPWLANIRMRKNDPVGAFDAGRKGIELAPDLPEAHYFYAGLFYMVPEFQPGSLRTMPPHFAEAIRLQPHFQAAWIAFGAVAAFLGRYADAIYILSEAVRLEDQADTVYYRFIGGRPLLAIVHARAGALDAARAQHLEAIDALRRTDHIYKTSFETLSTCGLGDIDLRCGNASGALIHYRRARRMIQESRRMIGSARLLVRANAGLAAAYAATGDMARSKQLAVEATDQLEALTGETASAMLECSIPQLWLILAGTEARLGNLDAAAEYLGRARKLGWLDLPWLRIDPELRPLRGHPEFLSFVDELAAAPDVEIPMPNLTSALEGGLHSASGKA